MKLFARDPLARSSAASGRFAPFPIEGMNVTPSRYYWDGGLVSNTPLLESRRRAEVGATRLEIVQIIYEENPSGPQFLAGDANFSPAPYRERFERGKRDMETAFEESHVVYDGSAAKLFRRGSYLKHLATG